MSKRFLLGVGGAAVVAAMLGTAFFVSTLLQTKPPSCADMTAAASAGAVKGARRIQIVIGLAGNTDAVATEAKKFVQTSLSGDGPTDRLLSKVTLVNGGTNYQPTGDEGDCVGHPLVVAGSEADLESYEKASTDAKPDVADALLVQYRRQVNLIADAVAASVRSAPAPRSTADTGAFALWPFVAQVPPSNDVVALGPFTVGGDNCLTIRGNPASLSDSRSSTVIKQRVKSCVAAGEVSTANASHVRLTAVDSLALSGTQHAAQQAVIDALCQDATLSGCRGNA